MAPPPDLPGLAALITAIAALIAAWRGNRATAKQLAPNGGSSLHDRVAQTAHDLAALRQSVGGIRDDLRADRQALVALQQDHTTTRAVLSARLDTLERRCDRDHR